MATDATLVETHDTPGHDTPPPYRGFEKSGPGFYLGPC
jgi:hypothetical protein